MGNKKAAAAWFAKARSDLDAGKFLLGAGDRFWSQIAFQCQQSAEKSLKGFLTAKSIKFKKTHNLGELINMVAEIDEKLASKLRSAKKLSIYAVTYRYPDAELEPLTLKMVNDAIKIAQKVLLQLVV